MKTAIIKLSQRLFVSFLLFGMCNAGYSQEKYSWELPPQEGEIEIEVLTLNVSGGDLRLPTSSQEKKGGKWVYFEFISSTDNQVVYTKEELYKQLLTALKEKYPDSQEFQLRGFKYEKTSESKYDQGETTDSFRILPRLVESYTYKLSAIVVKPKPNPSDALSAALEKALRNVRQGARLSIDQVSVSGGINRDEYSDQLIDILLDMGYKVVAKEYLEKLYEEQKSQQSGIFNERTTVEENNFSAVGYFVNIRVTNTSLRVQVINVSTGEYEGNATVKL